MHFKSIFKMCVKIAVCSSMLFIFSSCCNTAVFSDNSEVTLDTSMEPEDLVYKFVDSVNSKDVETYISLFTEDSRSEMEDYVEVYGTDDFFGEDNINIVTITKLSDETGISSAAIAPDEIAAYDDIIVYYTEEDSDVIRGNNISNDKILDGGINYKDYVIVKENDKWKILRVSSPNTDDISDAG